MADESNRLSDETVATLRKLSHDLSNAIENVMQASYLLSHSKLDEQCTKWLSLITSATEEAAQVNRQIREILRSRT